MYIMILMTAIWTSTGSGKASASPAVTAIEFSSRDSCIAAAKFSKSQPQVFNAFCVKK